MKIQITKNKTKKNSNKDFKKIRITTDINYKMQTIQNINNAYNDTLSKIRITQDPKILNRRRQKILELQI